MGIRGRVVGAALAASVSVAVSGASSSAAPLLVTGGGSGQGIVGGIPEPALPVTVLGDPDAVPAATMLRVARVGGSASRIAGPDRYRTAVAISRALAPNGSDELVLATGAAFPDALSAGPLAARLKAPLLLTAPATLPAAVRDEVARLHPRRITVVGGADVVPASVVAAAQAAAGGSSVVVRRLEGADRYLTSQRVAEEYPPGVGGVVIASGADFPDGVSSVPLAATLGGPVLLTPPSRLTTGTRAQLLRLRPGRLVVAGGAAAVSAAVATGAASAAGHAAQREAGPDRYATSAALAQATASLAPARGAWVATGSAFPDALAGGVAAAQGGAPILLASSGRGGSSAVAAEVARLRGVGEWLQLALDLLARQQALPEPSYTAYDAAYQADSLGRLYGWADPEVATALARMRGARKPGGGYGMDRGWDAFQDGSVNPASTSYLATITDHVGRSLVDGLAAGAVTPEEVGALVDVVLAWPRVRGDSSCLAYSDAPTDDRICIYNTNSAAAWFLRVAWDEGVRRPGQLELAQRLYAHDATHQSGGWWPYASTRTDRQDWNHNAAMIDAQLLLDPARGQQALDDVMPGGWVHPDARTRRFDDAMGYLRLLPWACDHRAGVDGAARSVMALQHIASDTGQLALWAVRTVQSCGSR